jgi:hypothetical protein
VADVLGAAVPSIAVLLELFASEDMLTVRVLMALASVLLLVRTVQLLRGFKLTGWRVMVLIQNLRDMVGFLLILAALVYFFAIAFLMLFAGDLAALGVCVSSSF